MATLKRKQGSPYWIARVVRGGTDHSWSTGHTDKKKAREWLENKIRELDGKVTVDEALNSLLLALSSLPEQEATGKRREIARLMASAGRDVKMPLADAWAAYCRSPHKKREESDGTRRNYQGHWEAFTAWLGKYKVKFMHEVTPALATAYMGELWGDGRKGISASTFNRHLQFLRRLFALLADEAGMVGNPLEKIVRKEARPESRRAFTGDELAQICRHAKGEMRLLIGIGLFTGLRLGDACLLRWGEVDFDGGALHVVPRKTRRLGKTLTLPLHPALRALLMEAHGRGKRDAAEFVLPEFAARYQHHRSAPALDFGTFLGSLQIVTTENAPEGVRRQRKVARAGYHSLRHSFASGMARAGAPQVALVEMLGHGSPVMTALYSHAGEESKAAAVKMLPDYFKNGRHKPERSSD